MTKALYHPTYVSLERNASIEISYSSDTELTFCRREKKLCNSGDHDYIGRFWNSGPVYKLVILSRYGYPCNTRDEPKSIDYTVTSWFCGLTHYTHENNSVSPIVVCFFLSRWNTAPSNLVDYQRFTKHKRIFPF